MTLDQYLDRAARRPFAYGEHDCLLFLADWVREKRGVDPAEGLRGRYSGRLGALRLKLVHGGAAGLVASCVRLAGLERTSEPRAGDIGLLFALVPGASMPQIVGAICAGERWVALAPSGLVASAAKPAAAWRV